MLLSFWITVNASFKSTSESLFRSITNSFVFTLLLFACTFTIYTRFSVPVSLKLFLFSQCIAVSHRIESEVAVIIFLRQFCQNEKSLKALAKIGFEKKEHVLVFA